MLVRPPSTMTWVWARARASRARASSRSRPQASTLAIIESNSAAISSPSATPVSTRTPGPAGRRNQRIRPGAGANWLSGSSALRRASMAWPDAAGGSPPRRPPRATSIWSLTRSSPVVSSVTGCSTWSRAFTSMKYQRPRLRRVQELDRAGARVPGPPAQLGRRPPDLGLLPGVEQRARRLLDHLLVAALERAVAQRRPPTRRRGGRRSPGPRRGGRS